MSNSPEEWYKALPKITKVHLTATFLTTCLCSLGFINPYQLHLDFEMIWQKFQIWRLGTCFLFLGGFSFQFLIKLMILYQYSERLEADPFPAGGNPHSDYIFMLSFGASVLWVLGYAFGFAFLGNSFVFMIVYVWSRRDPEAPVSVWGFKLKGIYLPWALMAFTILIGGSPVMDIVGVVAGHAYYFLIDVLPQQTQGQQVLKTPQFLINMFPADPVTLRSASGVAVHRSQRQPQPTPTPQSHSWGSGRTLGAN